MKKNAFSYLELIVSMMIIVMAVLLTTPFLTHASKKTSNIYGEFRCFSEFDTSTGTWKLYQQQRYNTISLSVKKDVTDEGCTFVKPVGAKSYTVTVVGGGGGGARPLLGDDYNESDITNQIVLTNVDSLSELSNIHSATVFNDKYNVMLTQNLDGTYTYRSALGDESGYIVNQYKEKTVQPEFNVYPAGAGATGEIITRTTDLSESFENQKIQIYMCENSNQVKNYAGAKLEYDFCVGKGGEGDAGGTKTAHKNILLSIYQDLVYAAKGAGYSYVGTGDGVIDNSDLSNLAVILKNSTSDAAYSALRTYRLFKTNENYKNAVNKLNILFSEAKSGSGSSLKEVEGESLGESGGYSTFLIGSEAVTAKGGAGGKSSLDNNKGLRSKASSSPNYYIEYGEDGQFDSRVSDSGGGVGTSCVCTNTTCESCNGGNASQIGASGAGGSIAFHFATALTQFKVLVFAYNNSTLDDRYSINAKDALTIEHISNAEGMSNVALNQYYSGNGGNGGGGAIIINW